MDDIGSAVGMSGPGLYRHFPGKEAVLSDMLLDISQRLLDEAGRRVTGAVDAPAALDALLRWHVSFALSEPDLITVQSQQLDNVPEPARRQIRRLQRLYVEEWVTVLSDLFPGAPQARLRAATHATFGLLNSTPHIHGELEPDGHGRAYVECRPLLAESGPHQLWRAHRLHILTGLDLRRAWGRDLRGRALLHSARRALFGNKPDVDWPADG